MYHLPQTDFLTRWDRGECTITFSGKLGAHRQLGLLAEKNPSALEKVRIKRSNQYSLMEIGNFTKVLVSSQAFHLHTTVRCSVQCFQG